MRESEDFQPRFHTRADLPPAVRLEPGEWLRWQVNYRFAYGGNWTYRLDTFNVANGAVPEQCFMRTPPRYIDELAVLR